MFIFFIFFLAQKFVFAENSLPNYIFIIADDMGWNDVGFHGSDQIPTPNIDALAYNGIILNHHYTQAMCTPSRSALLTGKYPIHTGMQHFVIGASEPWGLGLNERVLPDVLSKAGYKSHAIGKWHLGYYKKGFTPTYRGFESFFGYYNGFQDNYDHFLDDDTAPYTGYDMRRNLNVDWSSKGKYSADLYNDEAVNVIKNHNSSCPLFLYFAHVAPHSANDRDPFQAPEEVVAKFSYIEDPKRRYYAAMVSKVDEAVGKVVSALDSKNMLENSIIVFISDNGAPTYGQHENRGSNYPLRGIKNSPWEGGNRCVAAVWSPLIKKPRRVATQLMHISDWMPTLLSLAGLDSGDIDGVDMWKALSEDSPSPRKEFVYNIDDVQNPYESLTPYAALRFNEWKYINGTATGDMFNGWYGESGQNSGITYDPHDVLMSDTNIAISRLNKNRLQVPTILRLRKQAKITCSVIHIKCNPLESPCLFNLNVDPCEMINLAKFKPDLIKTFEESIMKIRKTVVKPKNKPDDCLSNPAYWNNTWTFWQDENIDSNVAASLSLQGCKP